MKKKNGIKRHRDADDHLRVTIDPYRLDQEWTYHPDRMQKVGEMLAEANDRVDRMKSALDVCRADTELKIRRKPAAYGLDKATDNAVKAALECDEGVVAAVDRLNKAKRRAGLVKALYEARKDCRPALENMVKLYLAGYFGEPKAPAGAGREQALRIVADELFKPMEDRKKKKRRIV